jgi:hypothetical protein
LLLQQLLGVGVDNLLKIGRELVVFLDQRQLHALLFSNFAKALCRSFVTIRAAAAAGRSEAIRLLPHGSHQGSVVWATDLLQLCLKFDHAKLAALTSNVGPAPLADTFNR